MEVTRGRVQKTKICILPLKMALNSISNQVLDLTHVMNHSLRVGGMEGAE